LAHFSAHSFSQFLRGRWCKGSSSSSSFLFFFFVLIFKDDCFHPRVSLWWKNLSAKMKTTPPLQEEVVKSQSALHVAPLWKHFGENFLARSALAPFSAIPTHTLHFLGVPVLGASQVAWRIRGVTCSIYKSASIKCPREKPTRRKDGKRANRISRRRCERKRRS